LLDMPPSLVDAGRSHDGITGRHDRQDKINQRNLLNFIY